MNDNDIIKAMDICAKLEFLCGQRAGRELWFQKPVDVQDEDIRQFVRDVAFLWQIISQQESEIETLKAMLPAAERYLHPLPFKDDFDKAVDKARAEAIREFAEGLKEMLEWTTGPLDEYDIDSLVKKMTEGEDVEKRSV